MLAGFRLLLTIVVVAATLGAARGPALAETRRAPGRVIPGHLAPARIAPAAALPPLARRAGPVPDYAPLAAVWTHPQLVTIAPALAPALDRALGPRHRVEDYAPLAADGLDPDEVFLDAALDALDGRAEPGLLEPGLLNPDERGSTAEDNSLVWMRDYQPIYVRRPDGTLTWVRYLHENPNRQSYLPLDDTPAASAPEALGTPVAYLPLLHENGNLVVAGRFVFLTELVFEENTGAAALPHLGAAGFAPLNADQIVATLARAFWREPADIIVLPRMPGEETGHVDLFLMPIGDRAVVVPEIRAESIDAADPAVEPVHAHEVRRFLDEIAARVALLDLEVIRLPMVPPLTLPAVDDAKTDDRVVYSPANGLLLRTDQGAQVLLPAVDLQQSAPRLAAMQRRYEAEWVRTFARHGWWARPVEATRLGRFLGLFRCVSQVVPAR